MEKLMSICNPTLIGLESLMAIKAASEQFGLDRLDVEDVFCNNAMRLVGLLK
jgi:hypothetical protein